VTAPLNLFEVATEPRPERPAGYRSSTVQVGPLIDAEALGAGVYDLDGGESICPYHYEHGNEEWLLVLTGKPTLRDEEDDEHELEQWDVVIFPDGPEGAHKVTNKTEEPVRIAILSTKIDPAVAIYPDSDKIGVWPTGKIFRLGDAVDYWEGET
jgi:uncharacterized cupin superfamily protein